MDKLPDVTVRKNAKPNEVPPNEGPLDSLKEASHLTYGLKWPIFKRFIVLFLLVLFMFPFLVLASWLMLTASPTDVLLRTLSRLAIGVLIQIPLFIVLVQMIMLGVRQAQGLPLYIEKINSQCLAVKGKLIGIAIIIILASTLREFLSPIPTAESQVIVSDMLVSYLSFLVFWIITMPLVVFAIPLVVSQKMKLGLALSSAYSQALQNWKKIVLSYGILALPGIIVSLAAVLGMHPIILFALLILLMVLGIWLIPMSMALGGVIFRDTFRQYPYPN